MVSGANAARIMWPLSATITAFVRRPFVMSMSRPLFRPSCIVRLVGAELGDRRSTEYALVRRLAHRLRGRRRRHTAEDRERRLDVESEGLLLLTDDGALVHKLTHPSGGCRKETRLSTASPEALRAYQQGVLQYDRFYYSDAKSLLEQAIRADSAFAMAWMRLAVVELAIRDPRLVDYPALEKLVHSYGLSVPAIGTGQAWGEEHLSFTDPDASVRRMAIERIKSHIEGARRFGRILSSSGLAWEAQATASALPSCSRADEIPDSHRHRSDPWFPPAVD